MWRNLNTVCSLQKSNCKTNNISRLITKGSTLIDDNRISDGIYNYFSTIDKKLDEKHSQKKTAILIIMTLRVTATSHIYTVFQKK